MAPRLLIVDDHDLVRAGLAQLLSDRWDICGEASNGLEAIEKALVLKPDLVLLDLAMPVMSGTTAAKLIREASPESKILILSMYDTAEVADFVRISGADGFVSKHSHSNDLKETIALLLSGSASANRKRTGISPL